MLNFIKKNQAFSYIMLLNFILLLVLVSIWKVTGMMYELRNEMISYKNDVSNITKEISTTVAEEKKTAAKRAVEQKRIDSIVSAAMKRHNNQIDDQMVSEIVREVDKKVDKLDNFNRKDVIFAIIDKETTWGTALKSWDGSSYGAMQVHYNVWNKQCGLSSKEDLYDTNVAVDCGVDVFMIYLKKHNGDVRRALQGYRGSKNPAVNKTYAEDVLRRAKLYTALNS